MMDKTNKDILKDEELFGGFDSNDEETFAGQIHKIDVKQNVTSESISQEKEARPTKVKKTITPPVYKPEVKEEKKRKSSTLAFLSAAAVVILMLSGLVYWLLIYNSPQFFLTKSEMELNRPQLEEKIDVTEEVPEQIELISIDTVQLAEPKKTIQTKTAAKPRISTSRKESETKIIELKSDEVTSSKIVNKKTPDVQPKIKTPKQTINQNVRGVFTIEAYSTESYDDARMWVEKLNRRHLNASILPHKIKDKVIYKVRFGRYETKEEASRTAMNLGLSRSFIDRIK